MYIIYKVSIKLVYTIQGLNVPENQQNAKASATLHYTKFKCNAFFFFFLHFMAFGRHTYPE